MANPAKPDFAGMSQLDREDKAVELMKEAGYGEGGKPLNIEIRYNTNPNHEARRHRRRRHVEEDLRRQCDADAISISAPTTPICRKAANSMSPAPAGLPTMPMRKTSSASIVSSNTTFNYGHYENPEFDALMKKSYDENAIRPPARRSCTKRKPSFMRDQPIAPLSMTPSSGSLPTSQGWGDNGDNDHLSKYLSVKE